jgi:hypothetical protein
MPTRYALSLVENTHHCLSFPSLSGSPKILHASFLIRPWDESGAGIQLDPDIPGSGLVRCLVPFRPAGPGS